jgi:hypothetical protein
MSEGTAATAIAGRSLHYDIAQKDSSMKKIIVSVFVASSLLVGAPLPVLAGVDVAAACSGDVPDAWKRPGGFCDQNDFNNSISTPSDPGCMPVNFAMNGSDRDVRLLLAGAPPADPCIPELDCSSINGDFFTTDARDRVLLVAC